MLIVLQLNSQLTTRDDKWDISQHFHYQMKNPTKTQRLLDSWQKMALAKDCEKIEYPKPDGVYSFDLLENLARSLLANDPRFAVIQLLGFKLQVANAKL